MVKPTDEVVSIEEFPVIMTVLDSVTSGNELIKSWMINHLAAKFQDPARKLKSAIVLMGIPGGGKGLWAKEICGGIFVDKYGRKPYRDVGKEAVERDFSDYLERTLILNFNEIASNRKEARSMEDHLKRIVTENELDVVLFQKGTQTINNYTYPFISSNNAIPINIEAKDRRYCICIGRESIDSETGKRYALIDIPRELPRFAQYLKNYKVDERILGTVPKSDEKNDLIEACCGSDELAMKEWLSSMCVDYDGLDSSRLKISEGLSPSNARYLSMDMMLREFNSYLKIHHSHNGISQQRFNTLVALHPDKIKCAGPRQRYEKHRIIPFIIECDVDEDS